MYQFNNKDKTIMEQVARIKNFYPNFKVTFSALKLKIIGEVQPTSRSETYLVEISYNYKEKPQIKVLKPELIGSINEKKIPHTFSENKLCLYRAKYGEFTSKKFISDTIIPWTSLWLYHYENWHITGEWLGGGEHPETK